MVYKELVLEGTNSSVLVNINMLEQINSNLIDLMILYRLTDYSVCVFDNGTREIKIVFEQKNIQDKFEIQLVKNIQKRLHKISISLPSSRLERIMSLFSNDMDIVVEKSVGVVKLYSYMPSGMLKILEKLRKM
jgi:hypothetical protein